MKLSSLLFVASYLSRAFAYDPSKSLGCHLLWAQTLEYTASGLLKVETPNNGVREYILDLPPSWSREKPMPLIIAFHGKNQKNSLFKEQTQLSNPDFNDEAIVAYPQAIDEQWTGDPTSPSLKENNDIEFVGQLIDQIVERYCIDMRRIYAVGFSNGGGLTQLLACDRVLSSKFAAIAIASGAFYFDYVLKDPLFSHCTPAHTPLPAIEFHGDKDPVIDYHGKKTPDGQTYDIADWGLAWAERNGCSIDQQSKDSLLYDSSVERKAWRCGSSKETVVHYCIQDFGHGWPNTKEQDDDFQRYGPAKFNATSLIMDFFREHPMPKTSKAFKDEL